MRLSIISKIPWIKKQKSKFEKQQRQTKREYVSGESHYFLGKRYLLNVIQQNSHQRVEIKRKTRIDLHVYSESNRKKKERILENWYRDELKKITLPLVNKLEKKLKVNLEDLRIKKMKTKWGTCNINAKRIWINLELAKKPLKCIEYIIAHEMIHFFERSHSDKFIAKLEKILPNWRSIKDELNDSQLGYSLWEGI